MLGCCPRSSESREHRAARSRPLEGGPRQVPPRNLIAEFGSDSFKLAAYNMGENKLRRTLFTLAQQPGGFRAEDRTFWHLYRGCRPCRKRPWSTSRACCSGRRLPRPRTLRTRVAKRVAHQNVVSTTPPRSFSKILLGRTSVNTRTSQVGREADCVQHLAAVLTTLSLLSPREFEIGVQCSPQRTQGSFDRGPGRMRTGRESGEARQVRGVQRRIRERPPWR